MKRRRIHSPTASIDVGSHLEKGIHRAREYGMSRARMSVIFARALRAYGFVARVRPRTRRPR